MNEPAILGNSQHDSDVLCYRKNVAYQVGELELDDNGTLEEELLDDNGTIENAIYEYVGEV